MLIQTPREGNESVSHLVAVVFFPKFDVVSVYSVTCKYSHRTWFPRAFRHRYPEFSDPAHSSELKVQVGHKGDICSTCSRRV